MFSCDFVSCFMFCWTVIGRTTNKIIQCEVKFWLLCYIAVLPGQLMLFNCKDVKNNYKEHPENIRHAQGTPKSKQQVHTSGCMTCLVFPCLYPSKNCSPQYYIGHCTVLDQLGIMSSYWYLKLVLLCAILFHATDRGLAWGEAVAVQFQVSESCIWSTAIVLFLRLL